MFFRTSARAGRRIGVWLCCALLSWGGCGGGGGGLLEPPDQVLPGDGGAGSDDGAAGGDGGTGGLPGGGGLPPVIAGDLDGGSVDSGTGGMSQAAVEATPAWGPAPLAVQFLASAAGVAGGGLVEFQWDFGDGQGGAGPALYHTFVEPGLYDVGVAVLRDNAVVGSGAVAVAVLPETVIQTVPESAEGVAPLAVSLTAVSVGGPADLPIEVDYAWDFGDGSSGEGPAVTHTFTQSGVFTVTLALVAGATSINCAQRQVVVTSGAQQTALVANAGPDQVVTSGAVVTLNASGSQGGPGLTLAWQQTAGPDVVLSDAAVARPHFTAPQVADDAVLEFLLTVAANGASASDSVRVTVQPTPNLPPVADAGVDRTLIDEDADGQGSLELDGGASFDPDGTIALYRWREGGTLLAETDARYVTLTLPVGVHALTLTVTDDGGATDTDDIVVTVLAPATLDVAPEGGLAAEGAAGGPFTPSYQQYTLSNTGDAPLNWTASKLQPWLQLAPVGGTLAGGGSVVLTLSFTADAEALAVGDYADTVVIGNLTNGRGSTTRAVTLAVQPPPPNAMTTASRTSGVAPLAVLFDAVDVAAGTTWGSVAVGHASGVVQPADGDFASFSYAWDFGDDPAAVFERTGNPRNTATGFLAAHVFEEPGTYAVHLAVTDAAGQVHEYVQTIAVLPFTGTTYYVSSSTGNDANSGLSSGAPLASFAAALAKAQPNTRILFKAGDTWTVSGKYTTAVDGPVILDRYGAGAKPLLVAASGWTDDLLALTRPDWRICQLGIRQNWDGETNGGGGPAVHAYAASGPPALVWGVDVTRANVAYSLAHAGGVLYECTATDVSLNALYADWARSPVVLGCWFHDTPRSHNIYSCSQFKSIYANNLLENAGNGRHNLRVCGPNAATGYPTRYVVISDNRVNAGTWAALQIRPNRPDAVQVMEDVLVERNHVYNCSDHAVMVGAGAHRVRLVNNVLEARVLLDRVTDVGDPGPADVLLAHNTLLVHADDYPVVRVSHEFTGLAVVNNILAHLHPTGVPFTAAGIWIERADLLDELACDYNVYHLPRTNRVALVGVHPGWTACDLAAWQAAGHEAHGLDSDVAPCVDLAGGAFELPAASPARDMGLPLAYARTDCERTPRPQGPGPDAGAYEYVP